MHSQHFCYVRAQHSISVVVTFLLCILPVVTCWSFSDQSSFRTSSHASSSRSSNNTSRIVSFSSSTKGSGSGMFPRSLVNRAIKNNYLRTDVICWEESDNVVCGTTAVTTISRYTRSLSLNSSIAAISSTSETRRSRSIPRLTPSRSPSINSPSSNWTSLTKINTLSEKQFPGSSQELGSSTSKSPTESVTYGDAGVRSTDSGTSVSAFASISSSHTSIGSSPGQPLLAKSNPSSATSTNTLSKAAEVSTQGKLTQVTSNLQDSGPLFSSQSNTTLSGHSGNSTSNSLPNSAFSSVQSGRISHPRPNPQITLFTSQMLSSFRSASATSRPTITRTPPKSSVPGFYEILAGGSTITFEVTSTITSAPPGFGTVSASNSLWTGDTTTVRAGTTYPVIYGCSICGGAHHGIILTGLGGIGSNPKRRGCGSGILSIFKSVFGCGTEFKFPPSWGLPPFIIGPLGNPIPLETQPDPDDPEPDPDPNEEPETKEPETVEPKTEEPKTEEPKTKEPKISSISASQIVTSSQVISSKATSSKASSTVACSATVTPIPYAIFLVDNVSEADLNALSLYFQEEVGGPDFVAEIPLGIDAGDSMFAALIDNCVASKIDAHSSVGDSPSFHLKITI